MAWDDFVQALKVVDPEHFDVERIVADATREHQAELELRDAKISTLEDQVQQTAATQAETIRDLKGQLYDALMKKPANPTGHAENPAAKGSEPSTGGSADDEVVEATFDSLTMKE